MHNNLAMNLSSLRKIGRAARKRPLNRQLLLSHLSVAAVGLVILLIALAFTYELRSRIEGLVNQGLTLAQAPMQVLAGVHHAQASLRGWVSLGDPRFVEAWQTVWLEEIQPALAQIDHCSLLPQSSCSPQGLQELQTLLTRLQQSQQQVREMAHTSANEPARALYRQQIEPNLARVEAKFKELQERALRSGDPLDLEQYAQLTPIHDAVGNTALLLREIPGQDGLRYVEKLHGQLAATTSHITQAVAKSPASSALQPLLTDVQQEWQQILDTAPMLIQKRQAADWNHALHRLATETEPLAVQASQRATAMAADARAFLQQQAEATQTNSAATFWIIAFLILVMFTVAYVMSSAHARVLARPITALAEATRQLKAGRMNEDIPVSGTDELAKLTHSFNAMRAALHQAQMELSKSNGLLEQRVGERTAQLAATNESLSREIAERNQADHALWESEARLRAMTQAIPDLMFVVDEDGRYREILATGSDRSAIGNTPIRGKLLSEVHPAGKAALFLDLIRRALQTRQIQVAEYELATASGRRWFESRTAPLDIHFAEPSPVTTPHPQGDLFGPPDLRRFATKAAAIVVARDITQRKHAETQLRQAQKMQAIGQLTGEIAHDFNNLLSVILGNLELLNEQLLHQPTLSELARQALSAANRGANLTQRLLAFSRRQPLLAQPTNLNQLVLEMLDLMRRTLGTNICIETMLSDDLDTVLVDRDQFENALLNLVINARDAMPQGGQLTLKTANLVIKGNENATQNEVRPGPYVMLAVSDTGIGMTPESLERAFEPFFTTKETGKGSGLGLSMVYGLVKQSNGHITIHSTPSQGTTVRLCLPRITTPPAARAESQVNDTSNQGHGEMVLVVEDDTQVRKFAVNALRGLGYKPLSAGDGVTALQILKTEPNITVLFTDIVMPGGLNGIELVTEARRHDPSLRVLFTSGYTEQSLSGDGSLQEGMDILPKPYRKNDLGKKLHLLLHQAHEGH